METLIFCGSSSRQLWFSYWSFTLIFLPYSISGTSAQHFRQTKTNGRRLETSNKQARKARRITQTTTAMCVLLHQNFWSLIRTETLEGTLDDFNFSKCHTANIIVGCWNRLIKTPKRLIKAYVQSPERDERLNNCHNWIKAYTWKPILFLLQGPWGTTKIRLLC